VIYKVSYRALVISLVVLCYTIFVPRVFGQSVEVNRDSLLKSVSFLASEELAGRAAGSSEDSVAAYYIAGKFEEYGMIPLVGDSYVVPFEFTLYREADSLSVLVLGDSTLKFGSDYYLHPLSPIADVSGKIVDLSEDKISNGEIAFVEISSDSVYFIATDLMNRGFKAILYHDTDNKGDLKRSNGFKFPIPVVSLDEKIVRMINEMDNPQLALSSKTFSLKAISYNIAAITSSDQDDYIMVGAHYDHLGLGGRNSGSLLPDSLAIHPGADDNASGVASILEIARTLSDAKKGVAVVAFGAEERGLIGSLRLADTLRRNGLLPEFMINLDMVGRLRDGKLQAGGMDTFENSDSLLNFLNDNHSLNLIFTGEGTGPSDHSSFYSKQVPVLYFTTGVHSDYHKPSDKASLINYEGLKSVTQFVTDVVRELAGEDFELIYKGGAGSGNKGGRHKQNFKVTLGLIPDFTYEKGDGFRIGPVNEGGAAYKSGLKEGDVITSLGTVPVRNIYDYMKALGTLNKGDTVVVVINRSGCVKEVLVNL
jgi:aminopeptidase YwaD